MEKAPYRNSKPPYLLGLLCFIPLVGAFVGLGLLLYGLIRYKDKWLCIIGASGIAFTVIVYSSLFYATKHSGVIKDLFVELSQTQMNSLVKNIEFYKLQHGQYPDSLKQLEKDDKLAPTADPIQLNQQRKNANFNYERVGDKYILFSSGEDGIPNTKDDFFPQIQISDSSKIGLIRSR
jgi:hypothetical protein